MATLTEPHPVPLAEAPRFVFEGVSWEDYEAMLRIVGDRPIRVTYDRGRMETHVTTLGSWERRLPPRPAHRCADGGAGPPGRGGRPGHLQRQDLEQGAEPDRCYYFGPHAALVRGRSGWRWASTRPPTSVIEADITSSSLDRLGIFAALGVPEVWRFTAGRSNSCISNPTAPIAPRRSAGPSPG